MIKPDAIQHAGSIIQVLEVEGFLISKLRMCHLTKSEACQFYDVHAGKPFFDKLTDFMSSGCIIAMELLAKDAISKWRGLIGPTNSDQARATAPQSIRARFGTDGTCNACHGSDAVETAEQACYSDCVVETQQCRERCSQVCMWRRARKHDECRNQVFSLDQAAGQVH